MLHPVLNSTRLLTAACIAACFISCGEAPASNTSSSEEAANRQMIRVAKAHIRTGDIVLRSGKDFTSHRIRELSEKDKTYSHAGIAYVADTNVYIFHIVPPDLDESRADSVVRREPIEVFARPEKNFGFGIVRYPLTNTEISKAMTYTDSIYRQHIPFDHLFDLRDAGRQYCSEMIDNILRYASSGKIQLERNSFTRKSAEQVAKYLHAEVQEVMTREYIPIDHLYDSTKCTLIGEYEFLK